MSFQHPPPRVRRYTPDQSPENSSDEDDDGASRVKILNPSGFRKYSWQRTPSVDLPAREILPPVSAWRADDGVDGERKPPVRDWLAEVIKRQKASMAAVHAGGPSWTDPARAESIWAAERESSVPLEPLAMPHGEASNAEDGEREAGTATNVNWKEYLPVGNFRGKVPTEPENDMHHPRASVSKVTEEPVSTETIPAKPMSEDKIEDGYRIGMDLRADVFSHAEEPVQAKEPGLAKDPEPAKEPEPAKDSASPPDPVLPGSTPAKLWSENSIGDNNNDSKTLSSQSNMLWAPPRAIPDSPISDNITRSDVLEQAHISAVHVDSSAPTDTIASEKAPGENTEKDGTSATRTAVETAKEPTRNDFASAQTTYKGINNTRENDFTRIFIPTSTRTESDPPGLLSLQRGLSGGTENDTAPVKSAPSPAVREVDPEEMISELRTAINEAFEVPLSDEKAEQKPTCSLTLLCYRSNAGGCAQQQIRVAARSRFSDDFAFQKALDSNASLVSTDQEFFDALRKAYSTQMCGFWRRNFSFKQLRAMRLLWYTETSRPSPVMLDELTMQEVLYAYKHPDHITTDHSWIDWVYNLRQPDRRHAIEFIEGWSGLHIAIAAAIPWLISSLVGILWSVRGGDVQTAFTLAGFLLTIGNSLLALLAIISSIES